MVNILFQYNFDLSTNLCSMSDKEIKLHEDEGGGSEVEPGEADDDDVKEKSGTKGGQSDADGKLEGKGERAKRMKGKSVKSGIRRKYEIHRNYKS